MKEDVYPEDIKAIPVKALSPAGQEPFISLEQERHGLWRELTALEADGFTIGSRIAVPAYVLARRFRKLNPKHEHVTLFQASKVWFEFTEAFSDRDLRRVRAANGDVVLKRETVARIRESITERHAVATVLARFLAAMPGTFADRQTVDLLPRTEAGLLALADDLREQEEQVRRRLARIEEIQAEIDRMAWELYRPGGEGSNEAG